MDAHEEQRSGFPEPPGNDPGDRSRDPEPHHALNNPADDPDPTEHPDPYDRREDPRDEPRPQTGSESTSAPHPDQDIEAEPTQPPERDRLDD